MASIMSWMPCSASQGGAKPPSSPMSVAAPPNFSSMMPWAGAVWARERGSGRFIPSPCHHFEQTLPNPNPVFAFKVWKHSAPTLMASLKFVAPTSEVRQFCCYTQLLHKRLAVRCFKGFWNVLSYCHAQVLSWFFWVIIVFFLGYIPFSEKVFQSNPFAKCCQLDPGTIQHD